VRETGEGFSYTFADDPEGGRFPGGLIIWGRRRRTPLNSVARWRLQRVMDRLFLSTGSLRVRLL
jgi:hypothetical protein